MRITRLEDRFRVKLDEVELVIAPLSGRQKLEMTSMIRQNEKGQFLIDKPSQEHYLVKHSVKAISGLKDIDEQDYKLEFDGNHLSDKCAEELLSFLANTFFSVAATQALRGAFGEVTNPYNGQKVTGVEVARIVKEEDEKK